MSRKPLFTDYNTLSDLINIIGPVPGELGKRPLDSRGYKAIRRLIDIYEATELADGASPATSDRVVYDAKEFGDWFWPRASQTIGSFGVPEREKPAPKAPAAHQASAVPQASAASNASGDDQAAQLASIIRSLAGGASAPVDVDMVREIVREAIAERDAPRPINVTVTNDQTGEARNVGVAHKNFPTLLKMVSARDSSGNRLNIWLPGPAGSGKTYAAEQAAKALGLSFYFSGALDSQYALLGFVDAKGATVRTLFREAYEHGGVMLLDETDASDPAAVVCALQAALANGVCAFPDAIVRRHPDCCIIASANTWGTGATAEYVGRMKQDAAFLSRFVTLPWEYDETLERALCPDNPAWADRVQFVRRRARESGIRVVISPRATVNGAALLASGLPIEIVETATLRQGMTDADWSKVSK